MALSTVVTSHNVSTPPIMASMNPNLYAILSIVLNQELNFLAVEMLWFLSKHTFSFFVISANHSRSAFWAAGSAISLSSCV